MQKLPATRPDPRYKSHAVWCPWRLDMQLQDQHGLFTIIDHECNCGYWAAAESDPVKAPCP